MRSISLPLLFPAILAVTVSTGTAAITTAGDFTDGTPLSPTLSITAPITFAVTATGTVQRLIFDEWVADDGTATTLTVATPIALSYQINGGAAQQTTIVGLLDNHHATTGALTPGDGYLSFFPISVTAGQTFTILPAAIPFNPDAAFNAPPSFFHGSARLANGSGTALSNLTAVPEPSSAALMIGASGILCLLRHRQR